MRMFLVAVLFLAGFGAFAMGGNILSVSQSLVHEIEGMICFLMGLVAIGSATITMAVEKMREEISSAVLKGSAAAAERAK